jgi:hypothetical protein
VSVKVLVEIDGSVAPLEECEWVWTEKCGCAVAMSYANTADEEKAWRDAFQYAKERAKLRRRGVTAELMTFKRARAEFLPMMRLEYTCPHKKEGK